MSRLRSPAIVAGAVVGGAIVGPPGMMIGVALTPFLEHSITRAVADFAERQPPGFHLLTRVFGHVGGDAFASDVLFRLAVRLAGSEMLDVGLAALRAERGLDWR